MQLARVSFVLLVLASSVPALAVEQPAAPAVPEGKTVALPPLSPGYDPAAAAAYLQSPLWSEWNARHGGRWTAQLDTLTGVPRRAWGGALPWISGPANALRGVPPAQLEAVARRFIAENPHLFGAAPSRLRFVPALASPTADGHMHYAAFDYVVDGVPVDHARLVFAVNNGNLIYWSATNIATVPAVTTPTLSAEQALRLARAHLGAEAPVADAPSLRLVPRAAPAGLSYQLTYALALRASGGETLGALVDAHSGAVLAFGDSSRYLDPPSSLAGRVEGGVRRALATDTEVVRGLPELRVDTAAGPATTNANGGLDFFGGTLTSRLEGRYVRVVCEDCLQSEQDPAQGFGPLATSFGVPWLSFGTGGRDVVEPQRATRSYANGTSTPAARSAYYNINAAHALVRKWLAVPWLGEQLTVRVNPPEVCNARWSGGKLTYFNTGPGCTNAGEIRDVVQHEWAHALDDHDGLSPGYALGHGDMATGEGMADLLAFIGDHDACIGHSLVVGGNNGVFVSNPETTAVTRCSGVRNLDEHRNVRGHLGIANVREKCSLANARSTTGDLLPNEVLTGPMLRQAHCEGEIYGQAGFHLAQSLLTGRAYGTVRLDSNKQFATFPGAALPAGPDGSPNPALDRDAAWSVYERLFYQSRPLVASYAPSRHQAIGPSAYDGYLVVDDEGDGLANGTPHAAYVNDAFVHHGIEEWSTPGTPAVGDAAGCPALGTPEVTASALQDGGLRAPAVAVSWSAVPGATRYHVLRSEHRDEPFLPVTTVGASKRSVTDVGVRSGGAYFYRVEAVGASACSRSAGGVVPVTVALPQPRFRSAAIVDVPNGNGDGALDPGERVELSLQLANEGSAALGSFVASVSAITPGIQVREASHPGGALGVGATGTVARSFDVAVGRDVRCGTRAELRLAVSSAEGTFEDAFVLPVGGDASGCNLNREIELRAVARVVDDRLASCGDGDLAADPGETVEVRVAVTNAGERTANDVVATLTTPATYLTILGDATRGVGRVEGSHQETKELVFQVAVGADAPVDAEAPLVLTFRVGDQTQQSATSVRVNRDQVAVDRAYGFESGSEGWSSENPTAGWTRAPGPSAGGTASTVWYSQYRSRQCDVLLSPEWDLTAASSLSLSLAYTTEDSLFDRTAFDGVHLQVTTDGGRIWETVTPEGGYPRIGNVGACILQGEPLFGGLSATPREVRFDLSRWSGKRARVRVRMSSDTSIEQGAGAWLDDVVVRRVQAVVPDAGCR